MLITNFINFSVRRQEWSRASVLSLDAHHYTVQEGCIALRDETRRDEKKTRSLRPVGNDMTPSRNEHDDAQVISATVVIAP